MAIAVGFLFIYIHCVLVANVLAYSLWREKTLIHGNMEIVIIDHLVLLAIHP